MTIEVFKTNVADEAQANDVRRMLQQHFPHSRINFDLHDCDKVLRIEGADFTTENVMLLVKGKGIVCKILD